MCCTFDHNEFLGSAALIGKFISCELFNISTLEIKKAKLTKIRPPIVLFCGPKFYLRMCVISKF